MYSCTRKEPPDLTWLYAKWAFVTYTTGQIMQWIEDLANMCLDRKEKLRRERMREIGETGSPANEQGEHHHQHHVGEGQNKFYGEVIGTIV